MPAGKAIRWMITIGCLIVAVLLERILTLGGITDTSQATQNPPLFLAIGAALILVAVATAILAALDVDPWAWMSFAIGLLFVVAGTWLRMENGDDSGAAIAAIALLMAWLSRRALSERRRQATSPIRPPGR